MWGVHLNGARSLLNQLGASETMKSSLRVRGQVGILVWYVKKYSPNHQSSFSNI